MADNRFLILPVVIHRIAQPTSTANFILREVLPRVLPRLVAVICHINTCDDDVVMREIYLHRYMPLEKCYSIMDSALSTIEGEQEVKRTVRDHLRLRLHPDVPAVALRRSHRSSSIKHTPPFSVYMHLGRPAMNASSFKQTLQFGAQLSGLSIDGLTVIVMHATTHEDVVWIIRQVRNTDGHPLSSQR
jgi:hypothetical protein